MPAAAAVSIPIVNPSFEDPVQADGQFTPTATGWTSVGGATDAGVFNPAIADFTAEAPDGQNVGYVYQGPVDAGLSQVLTGELGTFLADANYALTVKVGNSIGYAYDGYRVQLLAGTTVIAEDDNLTPPAVDAFVPVTVNYSYNAGLHASLVGQPLEIRLLSKNLVGGNSEVEFDDVGLSVSFANPIANAGGPYPVFVGGSLLLNGNASVPSGNATITTWEWDLDNDGDFDENITGATPAAISEANLVSVYGMSFGANTIKLRVTDSDTKTDIAETTVNILPATALVYEPFAYTGTSLAGQSGSTEVGLTGVWSSNTNPTLFSNLGFGALVTRGAGVGNLGGGSNTFGGGREVSASALSGNGLLQDGATLWFSVIMGYDSGGNRTNSRLALALANNSFNLANNNYNINGGGSGSGLGVTLGRFSGTNGRIVATQFTDGSTAQGAGFASNVFGTGQTTNVLPSATNTNVDSTLVVGRITWGAVSDTIDIFLPGPDLALPVNPHSTLTVNVNQSAYDTITWCRGDRVVMDEIRFGASYSAVVETGSAWDLNGTTAGSGGPTPSGTWDATSSNWNVAPDGTLAPVPWTPGGVATFSAGADATGEYTITVDGTRDISGIVFEDGTTSVTGGTALRLTGNTTVTVGTGLAATINTPLSEDAAGREMSKGGGGTLVLTADNSALTGTTSLNGGVTRFDAPAAIPGTTKNLAINANGTAMFGPSFGEANVATAMANRIAAASAGTIAADNYAATDFDFNAAGLASASLGAVGPVSYTGTLTPQGTTYRLGGGGGTLTIPTANAITGARGLAASGSGTVVLAEANDYTGATTVDGGATLRILGPTSTSSVTVNQIGGVLEVGHSGALGSGTLTFGGGFATTPTIRPIGTVVLTNPVNANGFNIGGNGTLGLGTTTLQNNVVINNLNTTNPTTFAAITAAGGVRTLSLTGNGSTTVTGAIGGGTGVSNITKGGSGTLALNGVNTYTGTMTVNDSGTLRVVSPGSLPGGTVTMNGTSTLTGTGTIGGAVTITATANIAPGDNGVGTLPVTGNLTVSAMAGSTGTLRFQLGPVAASDRITVGGTLAIGTNAFGFNDFVFTNIGGLQNGTYKLITTGAPINGTLQATNLSGTIAIPNGTATGTLQITGADIELVVTGASTPFQTWALASGLDGTTGKEDGPADDPDKDGVNNLREFAFKGDPLDPSDNGMIAGLVQDASAPPGTELTLVIAARNGATFSASSPPSPIVQSASVDGVTYTIEGTLDLATIPGSDVSHVAGPLDTAPVGSGLGDNLNGTGWQYHVFKLDASEGLPDKGFLRAKVSE